MALGVVKLRGIQPVGSKHPAGLPTVLFTNLGSPMQRNAIVDDGDIARSKRDGDEAIQAGFGQCLHRLLGGGLTGCGCLCRAVAEPDPEATVHKEQQLGVVD